MLNIEILEQELVCKEEECGRFKKNYLLIDYIYSSAGGRAIREFTEENKLNIGIYGAGVVGRCIYDSIKTVNPAISICVIDQNGASDYFRNIKIYRPSDNVKTDCIIVTPVSYFDKILTQLKKYGFQNIISLNDILYKDYKGDDVF